MKVTRDWHRDFDILTAGLHPGYSGPAYAFARYADGERAVIERRSYLAKADGWKTTTAGGEASGASGEFSERLRESLQNPFPRKPGGAAAGESETAPPENYFIGISCPCHHIHDHAWYVEQVKSWPADRVTLATLFCFSNYQKFRLAFPVNLDNCLVVSNWASEERYRVPVNAVEPAWIGEGYRKLVSELAGKVSREGDRRPIAVAAGPLACLIVRDYWEATAGPAGEVGGERERVPIVDIGSSLDKQFKGRRTRRFQNWKASQAGYSCRGW